jgi:hypothetical protein
MSNTQELNEGGIALIQPEMCPPFLMESEKNKFKHYKLFRI